MPWDYILQKMQQALSPVALVSETWLGVGVGGAEDEPISWPFTSFLSPPWRGCRACPYRQALCRSPKWARGCR